MSADTVRVDAIRVEDRARIEYMAWREVEIDKIIQRAKQELGFFGLSRDLRLTEKCKLAGEIEQALRESGMFGDWNVPTALYRYFDVNGDLLYVGISFDPGRRDREHARSKAWHMSAVKQQVEWYDNRFDAFAAEQDAIKIERPIHNVQGAVK